LDGDYRRTIDGASYVEEVDLVGRGQWTGIPVRVGTHATVRCTLAESGTIEGDFELLHRRTCVVDPGATGSVEEPG
jgi:hypothetical protein